MHTLSTKEWDRLYRANWRKPFAHLSKLERGILVRGCRGQIIFETVEEAQRTMRVAQPTGRLPLAAYRCLLCGYIHVRDRRHLGIYRRYSRPKRSGLTDRKGASTANLSRISEKIDVRGRYLPGPSTLPSVKDLL